MYTRVYSTARLDRYNHELEDNDTEDDMDDIMFQSFPSCSPRYSRVSLKFEQFREVWFLFCTLL